MAKAFANDLIALVKHHEENTLPRFSNFRKSFIPGEHKANLGIFKMVFKEEIALFGIFLNDCMSTKNKDTELFISTYDLKRRFYLKTEFILKFVDKSCLIIEELLIDWGRKNLSAQAPLNRIINDIGTTEQKDEFGKLTELVDELDEMIEFAKKKIWSPYFPQV